MELGELLLTLIDSEEYLLTLIEHNVIEDVRLKVGIESINGIKQVEIVGIANSWMSYGYSLQA